MSRKLLGGCNCKICQEHLEIKMKANREAMNDKIRKRYPEVFEVLRLKKVEKDEHTD